MQDVNAEEAPNTGLCLAVLEDIAAYVQKNSLRNNQEMLSVLIDTSVDLTRSLVLPPGPGRAPATARGKVNTGAWSHNDEHLGCCWARPCSQPHRVA